MSPAGSGRRGAPRSVLLPFTLAALGGVAFAVSYALNLSTPVLGVTMGVAFAGLAVGLAAWSRLLDAHEPDYVEERSLEPSPPRQWEAFREALTEQPVPRTKVLWSMFALSLGTIGAAALFPLRSLFVRQGGDPDRVLSHTSWHPGVALTTEEGLPIKPDDLDYGSVLTAFPEGSTQEHAAASTLLIRVEPGFLRLPPARRRWVVDGVVAYSRLCTHAGCPVGLYADDYKLLMCPCHHSVFDVLTGARPVSGPASRPLPQLPIGLDSRGYLVAEGDFTSPPGPGWWGFYT